MMLVLGDATVHAFNVVSQLFLQSRLVAKLETASLSSPEGTDARKQIDDVWARFLVFTEGYLQCGAGRTEG